MSSEDKKKEILDRKQQERKQDKTRKGYREMTDEVRRAPKSRSWFRRPRKK